MVSCKPKCIVLTLVIGAVLLVTGCVLITVFSNFIHSEVDKEIPLKEGSESYKNWIDPPVPIYFQVWMWDVLNPSEIVAGEKPVLVEKGPYTYREQRKKTDIRFMKDGTVSYKENRTFFFDRSKSVGPEEDTFTCINLIMLTVFNLLKTKYPFLNTIVDDALFLFNEKLFITLSVKDLMWGYHDPILTDINKLAKMADYHANIPEEFGLFYNQNGTDDGEYRIYSGQLGLDKFGEVVSWNGERKLTTWTSDIANAINGSDGTIYSPFIDVSKTKYLFSSDLCRSLGMDHVGKVTKQGIPLERFVAPDMLFGNVTENPYNKGFCVPAGNCLPSGLLNVSPCRQGAPIVMSQPNFLGCDPEVIDAITGVHPNREEHQSYLDLEPMTGVVMNAGKRLQINIVLEKIDGFKETKNIKKRIYLPLMWLNESALIDVKDADKFKSEVLDKLELTDAVKFGLIALGGFIILMAIVVIIHKRLFPQKDEKAEEKRLLNGQTTPENKDSQNSAYVNA